MTTEILVMYIGSSLVLLGAVARMPLMLLFGTALATVGLTIELVGML